MSPPLPPSPPEGPPRGTNFSRRNATAPAPPSPAFTKISASSMNCMAFRPPAGAPRRGALRLGLGLGGLDVHVDAIAASLLVLHGALDDRIEGEIAAHLD